MTVEPVPYSTLFFPDLTLSRAAIQAARKEGFSDRRYAARSAPEKPTASIPLGMYRVMTSAPLLSEPRAEASVVTRLQQARGYG